MKFLAKGIVLGAAALLSVSTSTLAEQAAAESMDTQICPTDFYDLPLFPNAKMCQIFGQSLPATMTYHATTDQQTTQEFYIEALGEADSVSMLKGRIQLEYDGANKIIMISQDGAGTQIDVLVKS